MTVERRENRLNRSRTPRRVRATGILAVFALSGGAGCGQSMIRRPLEPGRLTPPSARAEGKEPAPAGTLAGSPPGAVTGSAFALSPGGQKPSPMLAVPEGFVAFGTNRIGADPSPLKTSTTWNGWKLPIPKTGERDYLASASREVGIALPGSTRAKPFNLDGGVVTASESSAIPKAPTLSESPETPPTPTLSATAVSQPVTPTEPGPAPVVGESPAPVPVTVAQTEPPAPSPMSPKEEATPAREVEAPPANAEVASPASAVSLPRDNPETVVASMPEPTPPIQAPPIPTKQLPAVPAPVEARPVEVVVREAPVQPAAGRR